MKICVQQDALSTERNDERARPHRWRRAAGLQKSALVGQRRSAVGGMADHPADAYRVRNESLVQRLPNSVLITLPDVDHAMPVENTSLAALTISNVVATHPGPTA